VLCYVCVVVRVWCGVWCVGVCVQGANRYPSAANGIPQVNVLWDYIGTYPSNYWAYDPAGKCVCAPHVEGSAHLPCPQAHVEEARRGEETDHASHAIASPPSSPCLVRSCAYVCVCV
jgi:hypothetical protein